MIHQTAQTGDSMTIKLSGELAFNDHGIFRDILKQISSSGCKYCVMDVGDLTSIDSAGLGMLMIAFDASVKENWKFTIAHPKGQVKRLLEITDFAKVITIED